MAVATSVMSAAEAEYPLQLEIAYPEGENRFMILVRWLLAIPHLIIVQLLGYAAGVLLIIAFFAILFTRKYPEGMFRFSAGIQRWTQNAYAYILFHNRYPPFSWDEGQYPPVQYTIERREQYNRWLPLIKWLLVIPHLIVLFFLGIVAFLAWVFTFFAVLITGRYPRGAFDFIVGTARWNARAMAYFMLMVDEYPPFSMK